MIKKNQRRRSWFIDITLLILVLVSFLGYSAYLLIKDYTPNKETLLENTKIVQKEKVTQDESTKDFDEVIKKLEEKRNNPNKQNQLEIEKQAKIAEEKEKLKQKELSQKPLKKEQKMTRYEDWIDEPSEAPPVEKLELEKIQWKEGEGKPDER
mgnify:CR=1 FL=1